MEKLFAFLFHKLAPTHHVFKQRQGASQHYNQIKVFDSSCSLWRQQQNVGSHFLQRLTGAAILIWDRSAGEKLSEKGGDYVTQSTALIYVLWTLPTSTDLYLNVNEYVFTR